MQRCKNHGIANASGELRWLNAESGNKYKHITHENQFMDSISRTSTKELISFNLTKEINSQQSHSRFYLFCV